MKRIFIAATIIIALAAGYGARSLSFSSSPPVAAATAPEPRPQRDDEEDAKRPQWEHCAVTRAGFAGSIRGNQTWIVYFRARGVEVETVEGSVSVNAQGRAIHKLGQEGWEFAGEGTLDQERQGGRNEPPALMFKRQKR